MDNSQTNLKIFFSNKTKLKELVIKALQSSSSAYQTLIEHIQHLTRNYLKDWLNVLQECVSLFNVKRHDEILSVLQEFNWFTEDDETVKAYQSFWVHLVGAHSSLVFGVYCMIARAFAVREVNQVILRRNSEQVAVLLHELISMLISTVPTSTSSLFDSLRDQFPYYSNPLQNYQQYNRNLLIITTYCPVLRDKIIELIIDKLMQLELTLPNDSDLIYSNNDTDVNYDDDFDQFEMELPINNYNNNNNNNNNNKSTASTPTMKLNDIKILKESIDETMVILFEYIKQQSDNLMELLLKLFETKLLVTKYSKMTQFIIFYLCAVNKNNGYLLFLKLLIDKWSNNNEHISTRLFSLDYLCSFICRAKYIPVDTIQNIIKTLQFHLVQYIDSYNKQLLWKRNSNGIINNNNNNSTTTPFNPQQHIIFYNTFQGLIYILCFLYDVFVQQGIHVHEYFISLNLDNILSCDLKPLNYCMRDIVDLFIEKSYSFGTISVKDYILRNNNNNSVKSPLNNATNSNNENPLDTYFPFDPYLLTHSRKLVNPYYRYWEEDGDLNNATPNFTRRRSISRISNGDPNSYSRLSMSFDGNNSFDLSSSLNYLSQSNGSINNNNNSSYLSPNPYGNNNPYGASLESY